METTFKPSSLWNFKDNDTQHDLSLQRKEEKFFNKYYNQMSMLDDIGDNCLIDASTTSTLNETTNSLNATHQYLSLNKQNSFDHDESLGILTPDQMTDFTVLSGCSRTPSCENISRQAAGTTSSSSRVSRPTDIPFNGDIELPDNIICKRSPSLEELPLDPKPPPIDNKLLLIEQTISNAITTTTTTVTTVASGAATSTAQLPMSFVTSVTSITSLEAGYQGDGENSRPASRGPDPPAVPPGNLPGNLPTSCHPCRLQDPMTDSDFFTESDADAHEDIGRGDRRAQVIDGTLFCAPVGRRCPSFVGEQMDSSGIYSDLDKRQDEHYNVEEQSLSEKHTPDTADTGDSVDTQMSQCHEKSSKSPISLPETPQVIMDFLQIPKSPLNVSDDITPEIHEVTVIHKPNETTNRSINGKSSINNKSDTSTLKKYKMPKKNVASKIKAMIESGVKEDTSSSSSIKEPPRRILRTPRKNGRWDAVMSKIEAGKNGQRLRSPRKEIKSRISQLLTTATASISSSSSSAVSSASSTSAVTVASAKRLNGDANNNPNKDKRRSRIRQSVISPMEETARSSVRSSMSDLSSVQSKGTTRKRSPVTVNQQRRIVNGRNSIKSRTINNDTKKACTLDLSPLNLDKSPTPTRKLPSTRRPTALNKAEKQLQNGSTLVGKDRAAKEIRASPVISTRIPIEYRHQEAQTEDDSINCDINQSKCAQDTIQALCLTIQYLTRQLDECSTTAQTELRHLTMARVNLEEKLKERDNHERALVDLCNQLESSHAARINELENVLEQERNEFEMRLKSALEEYESLKSCLKPIFALKNRVIAKLKLDINNLQRQVEDKNKLQKQIEDMKLQLKRNNDVKDIKDESINNDTLESSEIIDCNLLTGGNDQVATLRAEIWSLRSVLEIRSQENSTMRSENEILRRECDGKEQLEQRVESLEARCEDLKAQLQSKESYERQLSHQNEILVGSFREISKHNKRLTQRNEEFQWRLRQKSKGLSILPTTPRLSRSLGPEEIDHSLIVDKDLQPTSSSMIKFMVQKGDSVSWTLEIDESCDPLPDNDIVSPIVSRQNSLRRAPRKSLDVRARSKSVSTSDVIGGNDDVWSSSYNLTPIISRRRPRSDPSSSTIVTQATNSVTNTEINLGARPQEAGGEAMISEETSATSSDDESSTSSDIARLSMDLGWENTVE